MEKNVESKYKRFIDLCMIPVKRLLRPYFSKFSKKDYTQHQLGVSVCLMAYEDKVYRDAADFLIEVREYLGFKDKVPHFTALQKFLRRTSLILSDFILQKTYEMFFQTKVANIGIDSTGEKTYHASNHYIKRMKRRSKRKDYLKHSISVDTDQQAIIAAKDRRSDANDNVDFEPLVERSHKVVPLRHVTADKGYDSEEHHRFVREDIGGKSVIPLRWEGTPVSRTKGKYRKKLRKYFPKKRYHRRSIIETINSVEKRKFGDTLRSRLLKMQRREMKVTDIVYNIHRYMNHNVSVFIGFLQNRNLHFCDQSSSAVREAPYEIGYGGYSKICYRHY
ncbi:MAG: IS5 family transposase [Candidatus Micrarchaeales archaeon]